MRNKVRTQRADSVWIKKKEHLQEMKKAEFTNLLSEGVDKVCSKSYRLRMAWYDKSPVRRVVSKFVYWLDRRLYRWRKKQNHRFFKEWENKND